jgi:hypothetical protein
VSFPYFRDSVGIASLVHAPVANSPSTTLSLEPGGRVVSHRVKYTHHPDGQAHFSLDGHVRTEIRKKSIPLSSIDGHFFTLHVQGLNAFKRVDVTEKGRPNTSKRIRITYLVDGPTPDAVKFVGRMYSAAWLQRQVAGGILKANGPLMQPD